MNAAHLVCVPRVIDLLRRVGAHRAQIAYLITYKGQLSLMRRHETLALTMTTGDKAQGREYDFVLLDLVTPGGRMCVALSRAKIGMRISGNKDMGEIKFPSVGGRIWEDLIEDHIQHGALWGHTIPDTTSFLERVEISGHYWELVERRDFR